MAKGLIFTPDSRVGEGEAKLTSPQTLRLFARKCANVMAYPIHHGKLNFLQLIKPELD